MDLTREIDLIKLYENQNLELKKEANIYTVPNHAQTVRPA